MSENPLLLSSAKIGVLVENRSIRAYVRWVLVFVGAFVVLYGAFDILSRLYMHLPQNAANIAFAPAVMLSDPALTFDTSAAPLVPTRLRIPSIGVDAKVESVGKNADGSMATPSSFMDVAWYSLGSHPGEEGNAVIDGHVNNALTKAGVFEYLSSVKVGDTIVVSDASGRALTYAVVNLEAYPTRNAPDANVFSSNGPSQLVLITCDGVWDPAAHSFNERLVVYARLVTLPGGNA